jgi:hypothetical protein
MKKRLLIIGLVLALAMTAIMPAPVMAAAALPVKNTAFKAEGSAAVNAEGTPGAPKQLTENLVLIKRTGEGIWGQIMSCPEWTEFAGTQFQITENATTTLNMDTGKFNSIASGTVTIFKRDASELPLIPVMTGKYGAFMHGEFTVNNLSQLVFSYVIDYGLVELKGITGTAFDGAEAKGVVYANLTPNSGTLYGPITIKGTRS